MPTWLFEGKKSGFRIWIGDLPRTITVAGFVDQWISRSTVATDLWNSRQITDINIVPNSARESQCSAAFITLYDRDAALRFWFEAETFWVACDPAVGHRQFPFRWLPLKWVMARRVLPGLPAPELATAWTYDPNWTRFDYETWIGNPNRSPRDRDTKNVYEN
jgi:hypothetical protein